MNARAQAARVVAAVAAGASLDRALPAAAPDTDRALLRMLCYGTLRWYPRLEALLDGLLERPARDADIRALMLVGLYQLTDTDVAAHAAVAETVEAARHLGNPRAAGLVNAVLRRFQRERTEQLGRIEAMETARFAHPAWLIERIRGDWPDDWQAVLAAGNRPPPMWLRVNRRLSDAAAYLGELASCGYDAVPCTLAPEALRLVQPLPVQVLPGFEAGRVSVQDAGAQLACDVVEARDGMRVLDACAAPGGKACHLLERNPGIAELVAVDRSAARLERLAQNLARLGLAATLRVADAVQTSKWWDGAAFDRILLDVPCSATGVIRRHPDIKLLRRPADIARFAERQRGLLDALWPLLAPGGRLVYASCSILEAENADVTGAFLASQPQARAAAGFNRAAGRAWGRVRGSGVQILPGEADMDGFYYACFSKHA
ncbi:MAG TPA: 16S rRNA (cytosine(967)-C(5))-methyltransferase RsmB [Gammaproteobacteria bacterium]|nr:16S rRNA (cytosine(967)-C(5))-methyltransferase RsmB [Gammaproteobacteria bacterium]